MNRLRLTQIYFYRWYIPELIRLTNWTWRPTLTQVPLLLKILIAVKLFAAPHSKFKIYLAVLANVDSFKKL